MPTLPRTMFEKIWDNHVVHAERGKQTILYIDLHLVHEVTSPQAFEGLRLAGRKVRRPERTVATVDHNVPTTSRAPADRRRNLPAADRHPAEELQRFRHPLLRPQRPQPGHRARHRAGTGADAAGHDDRLRRQPHGHARGLRGAGLRHRHQRGRARAGHADASAAEAADDGSPRRGPPAAGRHRQGPDPVGHRPDHHQRRHRLLHRIHRLARSAP